MARWVHPPLSRGEEERTWWEHFVMVDVHVVHNNNNSECPCVFGEKAVNPSAPEEPSRTVVTS